MDAAQGRRQPAGGCPGSLFTGQPQDKVVTEVLSGRADVGFLRTGVLEALAKEGKLDLAAIKVVNPHGAADFPQRLSTDLYPEWPLSAVSGMPEPLVKAVTLALLGLPPDSAAAREGRAISASPRPTTAPWRRSCSACGPTRTASIASNSAIVEKYALEIALALGGLSWP